MIDKMGGIMTISDDDAIPASISVIIDKASIGDIRCGDDTSDAKAARCQLDERVEVCLDLRKG